MQKSIMYVRLDHTKNQSRSRPQMKACGRGAALRAHRWRVGFVGLRVRKLVASGKELRFVYEAGPCGYHLYRHLTGPGIGMQSGSAVFDSEKEQRSGQDRPERCGESGASGTSGRVNGSVCAPDGR